MLLLGGIVDPVDIFNARGREIAADREAEARANAPGGRGVAPDDGSLFNGWVMCGAILGFIAGQMSSQTLVGAFVGALTLGGIVFVIQLVLRGLGIAFGAGVSGLSSLNSALGRIPQWVIVGALAGAACGAGIALWLDGNSKDLIDPAMRLAPVGAAIAFVARAVMLLVKRKQSQR